jgi:hypothetical protein
MNTSPSRMMIEDRSVVLLDDTRMADRAGDGRLRHRQQLAAIAIAIADTVLLGHAPPPLGDINAVGRMPPPRADR